MVTGNWVGVSEGNGCSDPSHEPWLGVKVVSMRLEVMRDVQIGMSLLYLENSDRGLALII